MDVSHSSVVLGLLAKTDVGLDPLVGILVIVDSVKEALGLWLVAVVVRTGVLVLVGSSVDVLWGVVEIVVGRVVTVDWV